MNPNTPARKVNPSQHSIHLDSGHRGIKRAALLLAAAPIFWGSLALAQNDSWLGASGGSWTNAADWSEGVPIGGTAIFNLGSTAGYAVTVPTVQDIDELDVDTDNVTLSLSAEIQIGYLGGGGVQVGKASGQNGSLTLQGPSDLGTEEGASVGISGGIGVLTTTTTIDTFEGGGFTVGSGTGSQGTMNVNTTGGFLNPDFPGDLQVGINNGTGTVNINGGTVNNVTPIFGSGGTGTLTLTNKGSLSTGESLDDMVVGENGSVAGVGTVTCDNSSISVEDGSFDVGEAVSGPPGATGTATFTNGGNLFADGNLNVGTGAGGKGSISVLSGSTVSIIASTIVGANGGNGSLHVSGAISTFESLDIGTVFVGEDSSGEAGTGTLQVDSQGTVTLVGTLTVASGGTLNVLSGGTLSAPSINLASAGSVNLTGGIVNLTGGMLTDAALTLPKTSTLEGTGTLTGNLSSDGAVSPGDAPGILKVSGNYVQNSDAVLDIGIGGTTLGTQYDQLNITGSATLNGGLDVTLLNGFVPAVGDQFDILAFSSESGSFSGIALPALPTGRAWDTSELDSSGIISVIVPEPASAALLLAASFGLACRRRRKC